MTVPPRLLQQCLAEALEDAPAMLGRCIDAAVVGLQEAEKQCMEVAQRDRLATAWWRMRQEKEGWVADYPQRLREAFAVPTDAPTSSRTTLLSESAYLSLVEDDTVTESIESARLLQSLLPPLEQELKVLDALMSSLQGLATVQADMNPLRPAVFVRALREMMALDESDSQLRALWLRHCGKAIGHELKGLYARLTLVLQRANVQEAGYRVRLLAEAPGAAARSAASSARAARGAGPAATEWNPSGQAPLEYRGDSTGEAHFGDFVPDMPQLARLQTPVDNQYLHNFLERGGQRYEQSLAPEYYEQVSEELAAIEAFAAIPTLDESMVVQRSQQYKALPVVDRPARAVDIGTQLSQKTWGDFAAAHERARVLMQLKQKAERVAQAMGLDVVRKLVNQVAQDPLLLAPVREAVVALEPSLLRLAMANPRFFSEDAHPARRLVECVAQRSFRYNDEFSSEFAEFFGPVQQAFNALNELETEDPQAFAIALDELLQEWETQDRDDEAAKGSNLQAIRHAEARQTLADQVAWDLSQRPDVDHAPGFILDFLYGPWALAIASAQLNAPRGDTDPGGYRKVVSNLLWSTKKKSRCGCRRSCWRWCPACSRRCTPAWNRWAKRATRPNRSLTRSCACTNRCWACAARAQGPMRAPRIRCRWTPRRCRWSLTKPCRPRPSSANRARRPSPGSDAWNWKRRASRTPCPPISPSSPKAEPPLVPSRPWCRASTKRRVKTTFRSTPSPCSLACAKATGSTCTRTANGCVRNSYGRAPAVPCSCS